MTHPFSSQNALCSKEALPKINIENFTMKVSLSEKFRSGPNIILTGKSKIYLPKIFHCLKIQIQLESF